MLVIATAGNSGKSDFKFRSYANVWVTQHFRGRTGDLWAKLHVPTLLSWTTSRTPILHERYPCVQVEFVTQHENDDFSIPRGPPSLNVSPSADKSDISVFAHTSTCRLRRRWISMLLRSVWVKF